jgi:tetratricopeptide (TPR) repeat protein
VQLGLDADVRELGSAFRAFGVADVNPRRTDAEILVARKRVLDAAGPALAQGDEAVLRLRAYQLRSFLQALRRWEATGEESDELRELGGDFVGLLRKSGWLVGGGRGARAAERIAMGDAVLGVLFKKRWNAITGVHRSPFDPTLDEERALFGFLLSHPISTSPAAAQLGADVATDSPVVAEGEQDGARLRAAAAFAAAQERRGQEQYRLKKIEELSALDPAYPRDLARGVVLYRLGKYLPAVEAFRRHLERSPDGSYALRARNYLRAALGRAREEQF